MAISLFVHMKDVLFSKTPADMRRLNTTQIKATKLRETNQIALEATIKQLQEHQRSEMSQSSLHSTFPDLCCICVCEFSEPQKRDWPRG
jgi:hypothetical protein